MKTPAENLLTKLTWFSIGYSVAVIVFLLAISFRQATTPQPTVTPVYDNLHIQEAQPVAEETEQPLADTIEQDSGLSSNGRTSGFEPEYLGSSPSEPAKPQAQPETIPDHDATSNCQYPMRPLVNGQCDNSDPCDPTTIKDPELHGDCAQ